MDLKAINALSGEIKIPIDIGTKLHIEIEHISFPVTSIFVGMKKEEYVIITPPSHLNSIKEKLYDGNIMIVKYLHKGTVYAFQTSLIGTVNQPVKLILLKFPRVIQKHELRSFKRNQCLLPARIVGSSGQRSIVMKDLNIKGCRCIMTVSPEEKAGVQLGDEVKVLCKFPGIEAELPVAGTIRNIQRRSQELTVGIEFSDVSDTFRQAMANYVFIVSENLG